jgi:catechol 2,3-dioxygenase-like lactoylglutathione lyase family enzyme
VNATAQWFVDHLGLQGRGDRPKPEDPNRIWSNAVFVDNVNLIVFEKPSPGGRLWEEGMKVDFDPTKGAVIDHLAFSYRDIEPVHERMKAAGLEIVEPISTNEDTGVTSFFVQGPGKLLIEIVEEKPIPEGIWE